MLPSDNFNNFSRATEDEIRMLILKSSDATCFLDPMPGIFPTDIKQIPHKTSSKEAYMPISNLQSSHCYIVPCDHQNSP